MKIGDKVVYNIDTARNGRFSSYAGEVIEVKNNVITCLIEEVQKMTFGINGVHIDGIDSGWIELA